MAVSDIAAVIDRDREALDRRPVSPTDISQYIRLDQCQRYLRLQLHLRHWGDRFLEKYDVAQQEIPPILTRSGATFEDTIEDAVSTRFPSTRLDADQRRAAHTLDNNADVIDLARSLDPGQCHVVFQPRLQATLPDWRIRGDIDLLLLQRDADGVLSLLIADMKSSTAAKVEHRLQVAIYHHMVTAICAEAGIPVDHIDLAIIYRGPIEGTTAEADADQELLARQREDAEATFGITDAFLERVPDATAYLRSAEDLLTGPESVARRILGTEFDLVPFHLTYKCDGCRFNEFCMKQSAQSDDLSLLPHLGEQDKTVLRRTGITSVVQVAELKELVRSNGQPNLQPAPGKEETCRQLAVTWPVGTHLDELIHRAQGYMAWKRGKHPPLSYIPHKGYGTLPYSDADLHPNLVRVYIDAQHDYLHDRIYMLGALVVASENGIEPPERRRSIIHLTDGPPDSNDVERDLFLRWIDDTLRAVVELAAPDAEGNRTAPIHLVFVNRFAQKQLLNGLGRYMNEVLGATALYDFMTQLAAFDSPIASFLEQEIREQKNYPMVCQSLQAVAAYRGFNWNEGTPYWEIFRARQFDFWRERQEPAEGERPWYTGRARFNSQIPLEFAYVAWDQATPDKDLPGSLEDYAGVTAELLAGFHARRLEAMEHIAKEFRGNYQTQLSAFTLPDLASFECRAPSLAHALDEFVTIERFVELGAWKSERLAPPEQRVLNGVSLVARYVEEDQDAGIAERNRENEHRRLLNEQYTAEFLAANPHRKRATLTDEQKAGSSWSHDGMRYRLRLETEGSGCSLDDALNLTTIKPDGRMVLAKRWDVDTRLPAAEQRPFTTTAKQLLYAPRVQLVDIIVERNPQDRAVRAFAVVEAAGGGGRDNRGFLFGSRSLPPLEAGELYTLETDPNNINGFWASIVVDGLIEGGDHTLYCHLTGTPTSRPIDPVVAQAEGQRRFLEGLDALHAAGHMFDFEPSKREFIGDHADDPILLVQGPPGTGKSFSTAWALLARIQGAMAAGKPFRIALSCKTHAATDVLLHNVRNAQAHLAHLFATHPDLVAPWFDRRLLDLPLFRQRPRGDVADGIEPLGYDLKPNDVIATLSSSDWSVVASTPGGIYNMVKDNLFGTRFLDCVVLDEASQMSIPEALLATLPLHPDGRVIVVGDHRQMPPIVQHDWANETRRTFQQFRSYESLFYALLDRNPPKIAFERSFRLHADLAEFLRKEIYVQDGIDYYSTKTNVIPTIEHADPMVAAALDPEHPLVVIVHSENQSQQRNLFEERVISPILQALADEGTYGFGPEDGLGVVVPHRAQRAGLHDAVPQLSRTDNETGAITISAVDTVERFQGDERTVILVSATESDPDYLLATGDFLLDPRRLTVALSRAKQKMILVASRSVFELFSADEETFRNAQLWKNLLRSTCTSRLWHGEMGEYTVEVWGNGPKTS